MKPQAIIFTEAGPGIGWGHLSRCCSLYEALASRGYLPLLVLPKHLGASSFLTDKNHRFCAWYLTSNLEKLAEGKLIIIDSYLAPLECYQSASKVGIQTLFFDDANRLAYSKGIILNATPLASHLPYPQIPGLHYLLGIAYFPIRPLFKNAPPKVISKTVKTLLITLGAAGTLPLLNRCITPALTHFPDACITVVATIPRPPEIAPQLIWKEDLNEEEMVRQMAATDLAISAGGQTLFELAAMGVPTLGILTAENQRLNITGLSKAGFLVISDQINPTKSQPLDTLLSLFRDPLYREEKSRIGQLMVDGKGAQRVVDYLDTPPTS